MMLLITGEKYPESQTSSPIFAATSFFSTVSRVVLMELDARLSNSAVFAREAILASRLASAIGHPFYCAKTVSAILAATLRSSASGIDRITNQSFFQAGAYNTLAHLVPH